MSMLKTILENTIKYRLGHKPSQKELESAIEYIENSFDEKTDLTKLETFIDEWRNDCCIQCAGCSDHFLPEDLYKDDFGDKVCSRECELELANERWCKTDGQREIQSRWNER